MDIFSQIVKLLFRIKYWLIVTPVIATLIAISSTKHLTREYEVTTTIYTGIASGFTLESGLEAGRVDWGSVSNGMDNLIAIIKSKSTLRNVSLRLYTQHMMYGDSVNDNNYIKAANYRSLLRITPKEVKDLIDKTSEEKTLENLNKYEKASPKNFVYGLFNWNHPHYCYNALSKIEAKRVFSSDMLEIKYAADDPGIAYNTLVLLNDEFVKQYKFLRFGETNDVVEFFRNELAKLNEKLRFSEDSLTRYSVSKKVINYAEQTKQITSLAKDYELMHSEILLRYNSSKALVAELEERIKEQASLMENNSQFLSKLNEISQLSLTVARLKMFQSDSSATYSKSLKDYQERQKTAENELRNLSNTIINKKYTKEGLATTTFVDQWVDELIKREQATADLYIMGEIKKSLDDQYVFYSPIGSTIKRIERDISFTEQSYLSILASLNTALMRQKTLQMNSANLKPINPPLFPVAPTPTKRKLIVITTFLASFVFVLVFFIILEIFDRTVRDRVRAERLIQAKVLGAFPRKNRVRYRSLYREYEKISVNYVANAIIPYLNPKNGPDIINFISTDEGTGKSLLMELIHNYWKERGLRVRSISWHNHNFGKSREFILSNNLRDLFDYDNEDIIMVEHRSVLKSAIPVGLLKEASLNILIVRADKVWRDIDKIAFERIRSQAGNTPLTVYITQARRSTTEEFVGIMPPYSKFRLFTYKLSQFGLTSK
jgi:capsular polysaccharide biosynthesis protein